jgi:hypothetical protein
MANGLIETGQGRELGHTDKAAMVLCCRSATVWKGTAPAFMPLLYEKVDEGCCTCDLCLRHIPPTLDYTSREHGMDS